MMGGAGFIESHLCEHLLEQNCEVIGLDNFDPYYDVAIKKNNLLQCHGNPNFTFYESDIRDKAVLEKIFTMHAEAIKASNGNIVHLAAKAGIAGQRRSKAYLNKDKYLADTLRVYQKALKAKKAFGLQAAL